MGKEFGNLQKLRGFTFYVLSPYELNPLKGVLNPGFSSFWRKVNENLIPMVIAFTCGYLIYDSTKKEYLRLNRKNPEDYKNDV